LARLGCKFIAPGTAGSRWNDYLAEGNVKVGVRFTDIAAATVTTRYYHTDHLGSVAVISNEAGAVVERLSYDAWGKRRFANGADDPAGSIESLTTRGFTGHEELDSVALVHMNGRVGACPRAGAAGPGGPDGRPHDQRRSDRARRAQCAGLEPLLLRRQRSADVHRSERLFVVLEHLQRDHDVRQPRAGQPDRAGGGADCGDDSTDRNPGAGRHGARNGDQWGHGRRCSCREHHGSDRWQSRADIAGGRHRRCDDAGVLWRRRNHRPHAGVRNAAVLRKRCRSRRRWLPLGSRVGRSVRTKCVVGGGKFENGAVTAAFGYLYNYTLQMGVAGSLNAPVTIFGVPIGFQLSFGGGIAIDHHLNVAGYGYWGRGVQVGADVDAGVSVQASNAQTVNDLKGAFDNYSIHGGVGLGGSFDYFTGNSDHGVVTGGGVTVGAAVGASLSRARTYTSICGAPKDGCVH